MTHQPSDKGPLTFQDVAACFSEAERTLLREWQKELYRSVMTEIHRALSSLGPIIATSVFSLKVKDTEELCPAAPQDSEGRPGDDHSRNQELVIPSASAPIKEEDADRESPGPTTGMRPLVSPRDQELVIPSASAPIKEEDADRESPGPTTGMRPLVSPRDQELVIPSASAPIKEEDADRESPGPTTGMRPLVSPRGFDVPNIDSEAGEEDAFEAGGESGTISGFGIRRMKAESSEKGPEKTESFIALPGDAPMHVLEPSEECVGSEIKMGPQSPQLLEEEAASHGNAFCSSLLFSLRQGAEELGRDLEIFGNQSALIGQEVFTCQQDTQPYWGQYGSHQHATNTIEKRTLSRSHRTRTSGRLHKCTECEKQFSQKADVLRHQRTHTGERPYQCTECEKSFSQKSNLSRHQLTHTGDRLYKCTLCEKSFSQKVNLIVHKRMHTNDLNGS
ncbi:zinc finger protein 12-like isoform X2 [Pleurodeles waltl]|uniref:zinc finger protein 12-like isoform X2 n=1 Tax=Pleurodeles waltl TaxID=8319 RepID=UPI00370952A1